MFCTYCRKEVDTPHRCDEVTKGTLHELCISEHKEIHVSPLAHLIQRTLNSNGRRSVPHKTMYRSY